MPHLTGRLIPLLALPWACLLCGFGPHRPAAMGAASLGVADAQVATGAGTAALYANPAGMAQVRQQSLEAGVSRNPQQGATSLFFSSVDNTSAWGLAAGVGYSHDTDWWLQDERRTGSDLRLGAAYGLNGDAARLLFGAAARRVSIERQDPGGTAKLSGWTGDAGITVVLSSVRLGVSVRNALEVEGDDVLAAEETPPRMAVGLGLVGESYLLEADAAWGVPLGREDLPIGSGAVYRVGGALQIGDEGLQLRAGYAWDGATPGPIRHWISAGLGWRTPRVSADGAVAVDAANDNAVIASLSLTLQMPYGSP